MEEALGVSLCSRARPFFAVIAAHPGADPGALDRAAMAGVKDEAVELVAAALFAQDEREITDPKRGVAGDVVQLF